MALTSNVDELVSRMMDGIDPILLDFIKTKANSFVKWDLLRFFYDNPHTADTVKNIANYAGRNVDMVTPELEDWVESGLMQKQILDKTPIYSLSIDETMRALIDQFMLACEDRQFRVRAVYHIIRGMSER